MSIAIVYLKFLHSFLKNPYCLNYSSWNPQELLVGQKALPTWAWPRLHVIWVAFSGTLTRRRHIFRHCDGQNGDTKKDMSEFSTPDIVNTTLFGKIIFVDIRNLKWGDYPRLSGWTLNPITSILKRDTQKEWHRGEGMWKWRQRLRGCGRKPRKPSITGS